MARIAPQVTERELEYAVNRRFSLENIRAANDMVTRAREPDAPPQPPLPPGPGQAPRIQ